ncbi:hypothetical protein MAR_032842 [Mya arenaria]|uniref:Uncharacterized protein n=1 Tax=Mya arenaria TaxID=6604 RepID=A0ABY7G865_MYAAR|nr:hypothetical protein MAR_032842 [Mya arenaria]
MAPGLCGITGPTVRSPAEAEPGHVIAHAQTRPLDMAAILAQGQTMKLHLVRRRPAQLMGVGVHGVTGERAVSRVVRGSKYVIARALTLPLNMGGQVVLAVQPVKSNAPTMSAPSHAPPTGIATVLRVTTFLLQDMPGVIASWCLDRWKRYFKGGALCMGWIKNSDKLHPLGTGSARRKQHSQTIPRLY